MERHYKEKLKRCVAIASVWAVITIGIEIITELTGIRKYSMYPEPKSFVEVMHKWPIFVLSGIVVFMVVFYWQYSMKKDAD